MDKRDLKFVGRQRRRQRHPGSNNWHQRVQPRRMHQSGHQIRSAQIGRLTLALTNSLLFF